MNTIEHIRERYQEIQTGRSGKKLFSLEQKAFDDFSRMGIPNVRHEEWKYTRISNLFNKEYSLIQKTSRQKFSLGDLGSLALPGHSEANSIVFVNGIYAADLSLIQSNELIVLSLDEAASGEYGQIVSDHLGHSANYSRDGVHALNTAFANSGVFVYVGYGKSIPHPIYIYNIADTRFDPVFAQPRSLIYVGENAQASFVETYITSGESDSLTNQVMEIAVEQNALVEYYKIQSENENAALVSTTHIRQTGRSHVHTVTVSLNKGLVRNNLNVVMEAENSEAHLYGLYYLNGNSHTDNHTTVDNVRPSCFSNELYKGILDGSATGVFNGKIFVRQDAQKTNAYQSNKNIVLSENASVNTKPQLEIFADDVKCSHGCTIGRLDEEGLFYMQSRGISKKTARSLLLQAFAIDILKHIRLEPIRNYVDNLISHQLESEIL